MRSAPFSRELPYPPWSLWGGRKNQTRMITEEHAYACDHTIHAIHGSSRHSVGKQVFAWIRYNVPATCKSFSAMNAPITVISICVVQRLGIASSGWIQTLTNVMYGRTGPPYDLGR